MVQLESSSRPSCLPWDLANAQRAFLWCPELEHCAALSDVSRCACQTTITSLPQRFICNLSSIVSSDTVLFHLPSLFDEARPYSPSSVNGRSLP